MEVTTRGFDNVSTIRFAEGLEDGGEKVAIVQLHDWDLLTLIRQLHGVVFTNRERQFEEFKSTFFPSPTPAPIASVSTWGPVDQKAKPETKPEDVAFFVGSKK